MIPQKRERLFSRILPCSMTEIDNHWMKIAIKFYQSNHSLRNWLLNCRAFLPFLHTKPKSKHNNFDQPQFPKVFLGASLLT